MHVHVYTENFNFPSSAFSPLNWQWFNSVMEKNGVLNTCGFFFANSFIQRLDLANVMSEGMLLYDSNVITACYSICWGYRFIWPLKGLARYRINAWHLCKYTFLDYVLLLVSQNTWKIFWSCAEIFRVIVRYDLVFVLWVLAHYRKQDSYALLKPSRLKVESLAIFS